MRTIAEECARQPLVSVVLAASTEVRSFSAAGCGEPMRRHGAPARIIRLIKRYDKTMADTAGKEVVELL